MATNSKTLDLDKLQELATAANRGTWALNSDEVPPVVYREKQQPGDDEPLIAHADPGSPWSGVSVGEADANMRYIVAAQPAVVLKLIAQLRHARALVDFMLNGEDLDRAIDDAIAQEAEPTKSPTVFVLAEDDGEHDGGAHG